MLPKGNAESPGTWWTAPWDDGEGECILLSCPNGHGGTVYAVHDGIPPSTHHVIADDGKVTPSVVCKCGWHEDVQLAGWETQK